MTVYDALGMAIYERQRELNEIRQALGVPIQTTHEDLVRTLRELRDRTGMDG
jgi:DNA-directed RNA polymerase specialized sigma24 family protein